MIFHTIAFDVYFIRNSRS